MQATVPGEVRAGGITALLLASQAMIDAIVVAMGDVLGAPVVEVDRVNCHHNFTEREEHFGHEVWLTRKGAIRAGRPRSLSSPSTAVTTARYRTSRAMPLPPTCCKAAMTFGTLQNLPVHQNVETTRL